ncbi:hypothetical protein Tco_1007325 [Tanacetum coccineum]
MKTPMSSNTKLTKDEECDSVDSTKYPGIIGSLLYLTASRPDIMFNVCLCARFQEAPKTSHLEAKEEYDIWAMEMEHYLEYIDNDVWKVIQNGNSKRISTGKDGVVRILPPVSTAEILAVEKERKARTILLIVIPKEHLRRFHGMDDAKEI